MAQEACAQAAALVRPLDDTRNVGHDERLVVAYLDDAQVGFERGESIVGDLGFGSRDHREQGALARIGEPDQPDVGQDLQFEDEGAFVALLARLRIARRLVRGALEMPVSEAAPTAFEQYEPLPPSPPSGPPKAPNFSRRKCAEPAPPCPERANIFT